MKINGISFSANGRLMTVDVAEFLRGVGLPDDERSRAFVRKHFDDYTRRRGNRLSWREGQVVKLPAVGSWDGDTVVIGRAET